MIIIGKDGKEYKSEKECLIADKKFDEELIAKKQKEEEELKKIEEKLNKEKLELSNRKKELAKKIEDADKKLDEAVKLHKIAKQKATELIESAKKDADEVLKVANKQLDEASYERMVAISNFNKEFGVYKTTITGIDAINQHNRTVDMIQSFLKNWFK
jgi:ubiquitin